MKILVLIFSFLIYLILPLSSQEFIALPEESYRNEALAPGEFPPPENLTIEIINNDIILNWDNPVLGDWIRWDYGNFGNAISAGESFYVASRLDTNDLSAYNGFYLTKISFFAQSSTSTYSIRVWSGNNAGTLLLSQDVGDFDPFNWNVVILNTPILIDASQELWFGYFCTSEVGDFPASCDDGPAVLYKGDMLCFDGNLWVSMSIEFGLDYNWNIQAFFTEDTNYLAITGFNIYRSFNLLPFELIGNTTNTTYIQEATSTGNYAYYVTTLYDAGESIPSDTVSEDVLLNILENNNNTLSIYPNPSSGYIQIASDKEICRIKLFDIMGRLVKDIDYINETRFNFTVPGNSQGIYILKIVFDHASYDKKIMLR